MNVDEQKKEQKRRDLEVEIVDLPEEEDGEEAPRKKSAHPFPSFSASIQANSVTRQRRLQLALTASILAIVVIVILGSSLPVRTLAVRLFNAPTPVPTTSLAPGSDLFYINGAPTWGRAYLDGHLIAHLPRVAVDTPLRIARGQHVMQWRADPFQEQRCVVSVPPDYSVDTCHYNDSVSLRGGGSAWLLSFPASLLILPDSSRLALLQTVQMALDAHSSTEIVRTGELYNTSAPRGAFITAQQPLRATMHYQLDTNPISPVSAPCTINGQNNGLECAVLGQDCHSFCADPTATSSPMNVNAWDVLGVILPVWDYTTLGGKSVAQNQPDAYDVAEGYESLLPFHIVWNGSAWQVTVPLDHANTLPFGNPFCTAAETEVQIDASLNAVELKNFVVHWKYTSGPTPAAGCVAVATPNLSGLLITPPPSYHVAAYCLQRFGVLLAANDVAHQLWPFMPMADGYEQRLARKLGG